MEGSCVRPSLATLFLSFLRLGVTAFGGPAMVAYIKDLAVVRRHWVGEAAFQRGVALCQTIPGATSMQAAAFVGLHTRGFVGGLAAYIGFGCPAFCLMLALTAVYQRTQGLPVTVALFQGLRAIVVAIVASAAWSIARGSIRNWKAAALAGAAAVALIFRVNPMLVIAGCGLVGAGLLGDTEDAGVPPFPASETHDIVRPVLVLVLVAAAGVALLFWGDRGLFELAATMMRVDLVAFGGGFASVPLMQHEVIDVRGWMTARTFMDGIALGRSHLGRS
jgi:chromate transporter